MYVCYVCGYADGRTASPTSDYHKRLQLPHQRSPPIQGNDIYAEVICVSKLIRFVYCRSVCVMIMSDVQLVISSSHTLHTSIFQSTESQDQDRCMLHTSHISIGLFNRYLPSTHLDLNRRVHDHLTIASRPHPLPSYHPRGRE